MNAVDTNVFVYSVDLHFPLKQQRALSLLESLDSAATITPWQVACELGAVLHAHARNGRFTGDLNLTIRALRGRFRVATPRDHVLDNALTLMTSNQLSYWDALLLAACDDAGVHTLYTEDLQSQPLINGVRIVNPLL